MLSDMFSLLIGECYIEIIGRRPKQVMGLRVSFPHSKRLCRVYTSSTLLGNESHNAQTVAACRLGLLRMCDSFFSDYALRHDLLSSTLRFTQSSEILKVNWSICNDCASGVRHLFERRRAELWN